MAAAVRARSSGATAIRTTAAIAATPAAYWCRRPRSSGGGSEGTAWRGSTIRSSWQSRRRRMLARLTAQRAQALEHALATLGLELAVERPDLGEDLVGDLL